MYEPITPYAKQFDNLSSIARDPNAAPTIDGIQRALAEIAENVNNATPGADVDNRNRVTLYRGLLAASRVIQQIRHA
ncbi:type III secretion protein [Burkholderia vietnamiensis]|uniref:type III secretion protein n=1 Tax=Burkholderia vietnamiensis TaxID=60552 RepID=UPI001B9DBD37|nr:type III secretion protein [Burkholderia vietnamiensis]MBR8219907.1 type III secretion protein [Burkholderia vietnamiensis]MCA8181192.1 type III secretion protein [Burkholderia vietnamiensis]